MAFDSSSLVWEQLYAFSEASILGAVLGACYDVYRSFRLQCRQRPGVFISFIADCFFWIAAAAACITVIFARRWGEIFFYTYLGLAGGFAVYFFCLSRFLLPFWVRLFAFVLNCISRLYRLCAGICRACAVPFQKCARLTRKASKKGRGALNCYRGRILNLFRRT